MTRAILSRIIGPFSVPCLLRGLMFFAASLTPSLIPRGPEVQGILGGLVTALGYLAGQILALIWRAADTPRLSGGPAQVLTWVAVAVIGAAFLWVLGSSLASQNDLRAKMGMDPADGLHLATIIVLAALTFAGAFLLGRRSRA